MRIAILAHGARGAGAISVAKNIIAALGRVAPENEYVVTYPSGYGYESTCEALPSCQPLPLDMDRGLARRLLTESISLPKRIAQIGPDVMLALADRGMVSPPCPQAVLIHRPQLFYPPKHYAAHPLRNKLLFRYHAKHLRKTLKHIDLLLCQTEVAKTRLVEQYGYKGRVEICPNAVSVFAPNAEGQQTQPDPLKGLEGQMKLFCLTKYYEHKNLESLIELFRRFPDDLANVTVITTVASDHAPKARAFLADIQRYGLERHILNVGPITQAQLGDYYRHCDALLLPTLLESFSATYIEAMHFGTPILTSDLDFSRAVCGDAALYFCPWDVASMRDTIVNLKTNPAIGASLVERGRNRKEMFVRSWDDIGTDLANWLGELVAAAQ